MKKTFFFLILFFCLKSYGQTNIEVNGWRGVEWDMTSDTVKKILGEQLVSLNGIVKYKDSYCPFYIPKYKIDIYDFEVNFKFDTISHQLKTIIMSYDNYNIKVVSSREIIATIASKLTSKYGEATFKSEQTLKYKWSLKNTTIELENNKWIDVVFIIYSKSSNNNNSEL